MELDIRNNRSFLTPTIHDWARKLIASEVDADAAAGAQTERATLRVYEKLRRQLCAPVGVDGFQALASRALSRAKSQSPRLRVVHVAANGGLRGLGDIEFRPGTDDESETGIILIAQLLGLFLTLLGEAATVRLIEAGPLQMEIKGRPDTTGTNKSEPDRDYFGPFEDILLEADQLRHVSERLENLANTGGGIPELNGVAGNIRTIATALDIFTLIRSAAGGSKEEVLMPPIIGYVN